MGLFGKSKEDTSQDQQLANMWKWIEQLNKNQQILIKNNEYFIKTIRSLLAKDKQHDAKDKEHSALIQGFKDTARAVDLAAIDTEGG